jgi:hypothetical protein
LPENTAYFTCKEHASLERSLYYVYTDNRRINYIPRRALYATRGVVSWDDKSIPVWSEWERSDVKEMKCNVKSAAKYGNRIKISDVLDDTDTESTVSTNSDDDDESGNSVAPRTDVRTLSSDTDTESSNSSHSDDDEAGANSVAPHKGARIRRQTVMDDSDSDENMDSSDDRPSDNEDVVPHRREGLNSGREETGSSSSDGDEAGGNDGGPNALRHRANGDYEDAWW